MSKVAACGSIFTSSFLFTLDLKAGWIEMEHLRYGDAHPVLLFHLTAARAGILESVDAHLCAQDTYLAHILWSREGIDMQCRVIGPMKNIQLTYPYICKNRAEVAHILFSW